MPRGKRIARRSPSLPSWESNLDHQAWWYVPLLAEPSGQPSVVILSVCTLSVLSNSCLDVVAPSKTHVIARLGFWGSVLTTSPSLAISLLKSCLILFIQFMHIGVLFACMPMQYLRVWCPH